MRDEACGTRLGFDACALPKGHADETHVGAAFAWRLIVPMPKSKRKKKRLPVDDPVEEKP